MTITLVKRNTPSKPTIYSNPPTVLFYQATIDDAADDATLWTIPPGTLILSGVIKTVTAAGTSGNIDIALSDNGASTPAAVDIIAAYDVAALTVQATLDNHPLAPTSVEATISLVTNAITTASPAEFYLALTCIRNTDAI